MLLKCVCLFYLSRLDNQERGLIGSVHLTYSLHQQLQHIIFTESFTQTKNILHVKRPSYPEIKGGSQGLSQCIFYHITKL